MMKKVFLILALLVPAFAGAASCPCSRQVVGPRLPLVFDLFAQRWPGAAFDTLNGNYFVVWTDTFDSKTYRIRGRLVNQLGEAASDTIQFDSSPSSFTARVAYNSNNQEFLVTWIAARTLYAQIVTFDGHFATPKLTIVALSNLFSVDEYKVVFNNVQNEYLLMYLVTKTKRSEIFLQRLDRFGNKIRPPFEVAGAKAIRPHFDFDPDSNRYFVAWETEDNVLGRIRYQIFNSYMQKLLKDARTIQTVGPNATSPRVVYDPASQEFVVFWRECFTCQLLHATRFFPDGSFRGEDVLPIGGPIDIKDIRFNPVNAGFLFLNETHTGSSPVLARVNSQFKVTSNNIRTNCLSGFQNGFSSLIYNPLLQEFMVIWNYATPNSSDDILGQRIRAERQPGFCQ